MLTTGCVPVALVERNVATDAVPVLLTPKTGVTELLLDAASLMLPEGVKEPFAFNGPLALRVPVTFRLPFALSVPETVRVLFAMMLFPVKLPLVTRLPEVLILPLVSTPPLVTVNVSVVLAAFLIARATLPSPEVFWKRPATPDEFAVVAKMAELPLLSPVTLSPIVLAAAVME